MSGTGMQYTHVGRSGLVVSTLGLGCNNFGMRLDQAGTDAVVAAALEAGITLFDTADIYGQGRSEEMLGRALGARRQDVVIATKFGIRKGLPVPAGGARSHVIRACEASLRRLGTEYIDLYYLHTPDAGTPIAETLDALDTLITQGKVRYVASSNLAGWQMADAHHTALARGRQPFVACQVEWSLLQRAVEHEVVPAARHFGLGVIPYFPLASGLLTGKYRAGEAPAQDSRLGALPAFAGVLTEQNLARVERLARIAEAQGHTLLELAMSWLAQRPEVSSVLFGATRPEQVQANVRASAWTLPAEVLAAVDQAAP